MKRALFLIHLIGFGLVATLLFSGSLLERRFQKIATPETKLALHRVLRSLGVLFPLGVFLLLLTGIGSMYYNGLGFFSAGWLTAKIIFFSMMSVNGTMAAVRSRTRARLLEHLASGETSPHALERIQRSNKQQSLFYMTQTILILIILILSVFKPE